MGNMYIRGALGEKDSDFVSKRIPLEDPPERLGRETDEVYSKRLEPYFERIIHQAFKETQEKTNHNLAKESTSAVPYVEIKDLTS